MYTRRTIAMFLLLSVAVQLQAAVKPITVEKPAGGEMYLPGQTQTVVLNAKTRAKSVLVELSRDGGVTFETLGTIDNTVKEKTARNRLQWTVDEPYSSDAVIRATSTDPMRPGAGTSDSFAIGAPTGDGSGELYVLRAGDTMTGALTVDGIVESTTGGVKFPDGTTQTSAQLVPIAAGFVNQDGTKQSGSDNFTSTWDAVNELYVITITDVDYVHGEYVTVITPTNRTGAVPSTFPGPLDGKLRVAFNLGGNPIDRPFQFVTFKP
ncbi:MAG: hypothetical protein L6R28_13235 [Planctomycetes bacterium]|nr:hypothetical protein [Planctomycetota bacterium]